jgi:hypothetical protein
MLLYQIDDVSLRESEHFRIPSKEEKDDIIVNDFCKLMFINNEEDNEMMWIKVNEINDNGDLKSFVGGLNNAPKCFNKTDLKLDDKITFYDFQICEIHKTINN